MRIYALLGPSGIGKSQIASSWVRRSDATFIMWIDAKSTTSILQAYEEGYQIITATPENINNNTQKSANLFMNWLRATNISWLIVFDAVPWGIDSDYLDLIPEPTSSGSIIITSQDRTFDIDGNVIRIEVQGLQPEEGIALMKHHCGDSVIPENDNALCKLGEMFSWNPLALIHAMTAITTRNLRVDKYLEALLSSDTPVHDFFADSFSSSNAMKNAIDNTISRVKNEKLGTVASLVLEFLSMTGQAPVPVDWIILLVYNHFAPVSTSLARFEVDVRGSISLLDSYFLLDFDRSNDIVRCHEFIRRIVREKWNQSHERVSSVSNFLQGIQQLWDRSEKKSMDSRLLMRVTSAFLNHVPIRSITLEEENFAKISSTLAMFLFNRGLISDSIDVLDRAIVAYSSFKSPEDVTILQITSQRTKYSAEISPNRAIIEFDKIIDMQIELLGLTHHDTMISLIDREFARVLAGRGDEARSFLRTLYSLCSSIFGNKNVMTLKCLGVLVRAESDSHHLAIALKQCRRLMRARDGALGANHKDTLDAKHNYAYILGETGAYAEAIRQYIDLLPMQIKLLGQGSPEVLLNRNNVAHYCGLLGQHRLAVAMFHDIVRDAVLFLGTTHRDTFKYRHNLAHWSGVVFGSESAVYMFEKLTQDRSRAFGSTDVDVLRTRNRRAFWVAKSGDRERALTLFLELHDDEKRVLGDQHWQYRSTSIDMKELGLK